jgi:hypothetical protein
MTMQRLAVALGATNLVLVCLVLSPAGPTTAQDAAPVLRGRAVELVDDRGRVRSRLDVAADGEVVLRLFDRHGTIRVKLGAGEDGSALLLLDETTSPGVHLVARRTGTAERPATTGVTLTGVDGRPRVIRP